MFRIAPHFARELLRLTEATAVGAAGFLAYIWAARTYASVHSDIVAAGLVGIAGALAVLWPSRNQPSGLLAPLALMATAAVGVSAFWSHWSYSVGPWFLAWVLSALMNLAIVRAVLCPVARRWLGRNIISKRVAVYGNGSEARRLIEKIASVEAALVDLVGVVDYRSRDAPAIPKSIDFKGGIKDLAATVIDLRCEELIIALPLAANRRICQLADRISHLPIEVFVPATGFGDNLADLPMVGGIPLIRLTRRPLGLWSQTRKRVYDCALAILLLLFLAPVLALIAIAIAVDSPGPVLFSQRREGRWGSEIKVLKFRTMYAEQSDPLCTQQSSDTDLRVTRVGRFLRSTGLDELPQLINVLRGDMSVIGPRPHATGMRIGGQPSAELISEYRRRAVVKPGIIGWAQINGSRGPVESVALMKERVHFDLYYVNNWSDLFDAKIFLISVIQLLRDLIISRKSPANTLMHVTGGEPLSERSPTTARMPRSQVYL